jgi:small GTP-binding protein
MKKSKITIIGDAGVGKTSLATRLTENKFDPCSVSTIGVHHFTKILNGKKFYIWDTAGQERFFSIARIYYHEASAIIIVFDANDDPEKIEKTIDYWLKDVNKTLDSKVPIYLFGNKYGESEIMESHKRQKLLIVPTKSLTHKFLEKYPYPIFYVNARSGKNITEALSEKFPEPDSVEDEDFQESQIRDCCKIV